MMITCIPLSLIIHHPPATPASYYALRHPSRPICISSLSSSLAVIFSTFTIPTATATPPRSTQRHQPLRSNARCYHCQPSASSAITAAAFPNDPQHHDYQYQHHNLHSVPGGGSQTLGTNNYKCQSWASLVTEHTSRSPSPAGSLAQHTNIQTFRLQHTGDLPCRRKTI